MSGMNLLPWRERQRQKTLQRWFWGVALMLCWSVALVTLIHQQLASWHQQYAQQQRDWSNEQHRLTARLAEAALWQARARQAQQVKTEGLQWLQQQQQAWRVLRRVLTLPPHGVQMTHLAWRDKQLVIRGWAVSAAHLQPWQDALQLQRVEWQVSQWRDADGLAMRQHAFVLQGPLALPEAGS